MTVTVTAMATTMKMVQNSYTHNEFSVEYSLLLSVHYFLLIRRVSVYRVLSVSEAISIVIVIIARSNGAGNVERVRNR